MLCQMNGEILILFRDCLNALKSSHDHSIAIEKINNVVKVLTSDSTHVGDSHHYSNFLQEVFSESNVTFLTASVSNEKCLQSLKKLCSVGNCNAVFVALSNSLNKCSGNGIKLELVVKLLKNYFLNKGLINILYSHSKNQTTIWNTKFMEDEIISNICSLPSRLANKSRGKTGGVFHHEDFVQFLSYQVTVFLEDNTRNDCFNYDFLSNLIGQVCVRCNTGIFVKHLLNFAVMQLKGKNSNKIFKEIFQKISDRSKEVIFTEIMKVIPWYGYVKLLLGDLITTSSKVKYVLLHKLLLMQWFMDPTILINTFGYLSQCDEESKLLLKTLKSLLSVWGDASSMKHTSYEQQKYISQAIIICVGFIEKEFHNKYRDDIISCLLPGMKCHLDSPEHEIRLLGMIVGQTVTNFIGVANDPQRLDFEFTKTEDLNIIMNLINPPSPPSDEFLNKLRENFENKKLEFFKHIYEDESKINRTTKDPPVNYRSETVKKSTFIKIVQTKEEDAASDEDSAAYDSDDVEDSDFIPYDMSNDTKLNKVKKPLYVIDCMTSIRETEDREVMEVNLNAAEELIKAEPNAAKEAAVEFSKVLLNLQDNFALDNFLSLRYGAMIALTVCNPVQVSEYLTKQFYSENYNLQQRMDMLHVLTGAAGTLSKIEKLDPNKLQKELKPSVTTADTSSWKEIVNKRIESKTRRFGKKRSQPLSPQALRFNSIAGYFFYPLLQGYDKQIRTLDLLGTDSIVLGRLLFSLGSILYSAANSTNVQSMAKSLLEFCLEFRFHSEAYVRQATLYCVSMAMLSVPPDLQDNDILIQIRMWMEKVIASDSNRRTQELAAQTAMLMDVKIRSSLTA